MRKRATSTIDVHADGQEEAGEEHARGTASLSNFRCMKYAATITNLTTIIEQQATIDERPAVMPT